MQGDTQADPSAGKDQEGNPKSLPVDAASATQSSLQIDWKAQDLSQLISVHCSQLTTLIVSCSNSSSQVIEPANRCVST